MEWWQAAIFGAIGASSGVALTWIAPDESGTFDRVPQDWRDATWRTTTVIWVLLGAIVAVVRNFDIELDATTCFAYGIAAPYVIQRTLAVARNNLAIKADDPQHISKPASEPAPEPAPEDDPKPAPEDDPKPA